MLSTSPHALHSHVQCCIRSVPACNVASPSQITNAPRLQSRETAMMEERLAKLKRSLANERSSNSQHLAKNGGVFWDGARKIKGNYAKMVMSEAERRARKARRKKGKKTSRDRSTSRSKSGATKRRPGSSSYAPPLRGERVPPNMKKVLAEFSPAVRKALRGYTDDHIRLLSRAELIDLLGKVQGARLYKKLHPWPVGRVNVRDVLRDFSPSVQRELGAFSASDIRLLTREDLIEICGEEEGLRLYKRLHPRPNAKSIINDLAPGLRDFFQSYTEADMQRLTRQDYIDICGEAVGSRLYSRVHPPTPPPDVKKVLTKFSPAIRRELAKFSAWDIRKMTRQTLIEKFGRAEGARLFDKLHPGRDKDESSEIQVTAAQVQEILATFPPGIQQELRSLPADKLRGLSRAELVEMCGRMHGARLFDQLHPKRSAKETLSDFSDAIRSELGSFSDKDIRLLTRKDLIEICGKSEGIRLYNRLHTIEEEEEKGAAGGSRAGGKKGAAGSRSGKHGPARPAFEGPSLLDGTFDEKGGHASFLQARREFLEFASRPTPKKSKPQKPPFEGPSLLDGTFDEEGGHASFLEARREFLVAALGLSGKSYQTKPRPRPVPKPAMSREDAETEKFRDARAEFLAQAGLADLSKRDPNFRLPSADAKNTSSWRPGVSEGKEGGGLSGMLGVLGISDKSEAGAASAQGKDQGMNVHQGNEKASCYNCYKLFFKEKGVVGIEGKGYCSDQCRATGDKEQTRFKARPVAPEPVKAEPAAAGPIVEIPDDSDDD